MYVGDKFLKELRLHLTACMNMRAKLDEINDFEKKIL